MRRKLLCDKTPECQHPPLRSRRFCDLDALRLLLRALQLLRLARAVLPQRVAQVRPEVRGFRRRGAVSLGAGPSRSAVAAHSDLRFYVGMRAPPQAVAPTFEMHIIVRKEGMIKGPTTPYTQHSPNRSEPDPLAPRRQHERVLQGTGYWKHGHHVLKHLL